MVQGMQASSGKPARKRLPLGSSKAWKRDRSSAMPGLSSLRIMQHCAHCMSHSVSRFSEPPTTQECLACSVEEVVGSMPSRRATTSTYSSRRCSSISSLLGLPRGAKAASEVTPAKRPRTTTEAQPGDEVLDSVLSALDHPSGASDTSREMLRLMARGCLRTPAGDRHPYQKAVAGMFRELFSNIEDGMRREINNGTEQKGEAKAAKESRLQDVGRSRGELTRRAAELEDKINAFSDDNLALQAAATAQRAASEELARTAGALKEAETLRDAVEAALTRNFRPLLEGASADAARDLEVVAPLLKRIAVEESLESAFMVAAKMKPEARGIFDKAAMDQLHTEFEKQVVRLREEAAAKAAHPALRAAQDAAQAAEGRLAEARGRQEQSARALRLAEIDHQEAEGARGTADEAVQEADEALRMVEARCVALERSLHAFRSGPLASLHTLLADEPAAKGGAEKTQADGEKAACAAALIANVPTPTRVVVAA